MPPRTTALLALALAAVLTACGGDSGSAAGSGPATVVDSTPAPDSTRSPGTPSPDSAPASPAPQGLQTSAPEVIATGLEVPWGIDWLPGGDALLTERDSARVLRLPAGGGPAQEVTRLPLTRPRGEGGLLGLALSPTFEQDSLVYVYLTTAEDNRVVRFPLDDPSAVEPVLTGIPAAAIHNGGRIVFGPDGHLYVGTGDAGVGARAQDPASLGGKVLRMTPEGDPVPGQSSLVFSMGHRNVEGLAFDEDGRLYAVEFGENRFDEVNQVSQGTNGGWPEVEGPGGGGRYLEPIVTWRPAEASPAGGAVVGGSLWVAALRGERLWEVPLDGQGGAGQPQALYEGQYGRLRTPAQAPDGSLWVLTSNRDGRGDPVAEDDRIVRVPPR